MTQKVGTAKLGVVASLTYLELWMMKEVELTEQEFDQLLETIIDYLGDARDERYRLKKD